MNKNRAWIWLVVLLLVLAGAYIAYDKLSQKGGDARLQTLTNQDSRPGEGETVTAIVPGPQSPEEETTEASSDAFQEAPDVTVYDAEGKAYKLSDFRGKPVVLNFWASWCPPCQVEMPDFQERFQEWEDRVHFLMVNVTDNQRETVHVAAAFIRDKGYTFPVYYDTSQEAAITYQAFSIPRTFFIDAQGKLVANALGSISGDILQKGIELIQKPAAP